MIGERSRIQREHNRRPDGSANLLPRCANSMRDQKPRLRKFACLAAITAMLALSGRAAERDLMIYCSCGRPKDAVPRCEGLKLPRG
jgi:hypothetical protein